MSQPTRRSETPLLRGLDEATAVPSIVRSSLVRPLSVRLRRRLLALACGLSLAALSTTGVAADELETSEGLTLRGTVERLADGRYRLTNASGTTVLSAERVKDWRKGPSAHERFRQRLEALGRTDAAAKDRVALALEAEAAGVETVMAAAFEAVLVDEPDHALARRKLGYERVDGAWLTREAAHRARGLVRFGGRWMLPAQVEQNARQGGPLVPSFEVARDVDKARELIRLAAAKDTLVKQAAAVALAETKATTRLEAALREIHHRKAEVRVEACRQLGALGDEAGLRPLIFRGSRDLDAAVRREAVTAAASLGHDDTAVPFIKELYSQNPKIAGQAAEALAQLGDERAANYIVKRLVSHGYSARQHVSFLNQVSYVRDYEVEIAQAAAIANPEVATVLEGTVLDVKVRDAGFTKTWVEPILVRSLGNLVGESFADKAEALAWYSKNKRRLPTFPERPRGRVRLAD